MAPEQTPPIARTSHDHGIAMVEGCYWCGLNKPFNLPPEVVDAASKGRIVVFAGAGVSTEGKGIYPWSFYDDIKDKLKLPDDAKPSFPELMSAFCSPPRSRKQLFEEIMGRIDYVKSFTELYEKATAFHRQLSTMPHVHEVFTTNWDDFFEQECSATPIVTGEDFAVSADVPGRKVYKLHGSINNFGSIVATQEDYRRCYRRLSANILGAKFKTTLMTGLVIFFGFSFDDEDFQKLYRYLYKDVKGLVPHSYVVTLDEKASEKIKSLKMNATPIPTSAPYFLEVLKDQLVKKREMVPDANYADIDSTWRAVMTEHGKITPQQVHQYPDSIYSLTYQDGLQHAFEHIKATMKSGKNSDPQHMVRTVLSYGVIIKEKLHEKNYPDVAYFTGYQNGLYYFLSDASNRLPLPMYFLFGQGDTMTFKGYMASLNTGTSAHKAAHQLAEKLVETIPSTDLLFHRSPFL
jgi:NAD-dependent SIR2 family protein deacetylase